MNIQQLENELWEAADQLRANSKLTASEYSMPVLGLIFLRHADNRFKTYLPEIEADIPSRVPASRREALIKLAFQGKAAIYLPEQARFDRLAALPQGAHVGEAIDAAMDAIEADYDVLKGALPRGYVREELDNEEQLAVFDLLQKDSLSRSELESIKKTAVDLLAKLQDIQLQIDHWREKASAQAQMRAEIIKHLFANMPGNRYSDDEISQKADALFAHIYTSGDGSASATIH